jgi:hypothetical protein
LVSAMLEFLQKGLRCPIRYASFVFKDRDHKTGETRLGSKWARKSSDGAGPIHLVAAETVILPNGDTAAT